MGIDRAQADALLEAWTERDDAGDIVGLGVTHNPTAHQMTIAGVRMWAWCGMDTLIFTHVLNTPITITSTAPDSGEIVRLHAHPSGVTDITPPGAVITQRVPSDDQVDLSTQSTIWGTFCHHNLFFPDRAQAERWAAGRDDIVILSIEDGFAAARDMAGALLGYEPETSRLTELPDPELNKARATAALTPPARHLHRWVLTAFAETGHAPSRTDLERMARDHDIDPGAALSELTSRDVLAVDEQGEIRAAYPFSPVQTRHRVTWDGGTGGYAMCAIDALGISAMLGVPVTITSSEPDTHRTVTVEVDRDTARWSPETAVVFAGRMAAGSDTACCPSVDRTCGHINFFTTPDAGREWAARNPGVTGTVLDQDQALTCGIAEFGDLMQPLHRKLGR